CGRWGRCPGRCWSSRRPRVSGGRAPTRPPHAPRRPAMSPSLHRSAFFARLAPLLLLAACSGGAPSADTPAPAGGVQAAANAMPDVAQQYGPDVQANLERVRAVTDRYHDIAAAHADGYP